MPVNLLCAVQAVAAKVHAYDRTFVPATMVTPEDSVIPPFAILPVSMEVLVPGHTHVAALWVDSQARTVINLFVALFV